MSKKSKAKKSVVAESTVTGWGIEGKTRTGWGILYGERERARAVYHLKYLRRVEPSRDYRLVRIETKTTQTVEDV